MNRVEGGVEGGVVERPFLIAVGRGTGDVEGELADGARCESATRPCQTREMRSVARWDCDGAVV